MNETDLFTYLQTKIENLGYTVSELFPDEQLTEFPLVFIQIKENSNTGQFDNVDDIDIGVTILLYDEYIDDCREKSKIIKDSLKSDDNNFTNIISTTVPVNIDGQFISQSTIEFEYN